MIILYQWIFAHLLADFVLQTKKMVQHKKRLKAKSWVLYFHCFLHAGLIYLFSPDKSYWLIPAIVAVTHYLIDLWKLHQKDNFAAFITDQLLHIIVLFILWLIYYQADGWWNQKLAQSLNNIHYYVIATGYIIISFPLSYMLGYATQKWRHEIETTSSRSLISLSEAGKWIGIFERILVFTFVITNHFEGIGFLITAKSILRFNDIKDANMPKEAEYILIGTLMSFSASILTGLIINILLK